MAARFRRRPPLRPGAAVALGLALAAALFAAAPAQVLLGSIKTEQHDVTGDVYALDDRTIEVRKFTYDGLGPDAFWYGDLGDRATAAGAILPDRQSCGKRKLPAFRTPTTVVVEMPPGKKIADYGYISVWCRLAGVSFGGLAVPKARLADLPKGGAGECGDKAGGASGGAAGGEAAGKEPFPVKAGMSCEPLGGEDMLQLRWEVKGDDVNVELVGRITDTQYMGFGPSGSDTATVMVGSDPAICLLGDDAKYTAIDYYMTSRAPCAGGVGVCPDVDLGGKAGPAADQLSKQSGERSGDLVAVRYTRPLRAVDAKADRPISIAKGVSTFVTWAVGPTSSLASSGRTVLDHGRDATVAPRGPVSFEFGRAAKSNCDAFVTKATASGGGPDKPAVPDVDPFERPVRIADPDLELFARIGPSGGDRGLQAIAQRPGWGIAWYISQGVGPPVLAQTIGVERGKEYTFRVMGGDDPEDPSNYHPFYITSSEIGGATKNETVYAGPASGKECRLKVGKKTADAKTYTEFWRSLDSDCIHDTEILSGGGVLKWKVEDTTPDIVWYQCRTHGLLGWRIRVFDAGKATTEELEKVNVAKRLEADTTQTDNCKVEFKGNTRNFQGCRKGLEGGMDVYWNIDDSAKTIETLFSGTPGSDGGYIGWGWGQRSMVPSGGGAAAIAFSDPDSGNVVVRDYSLTARSSSGVKPGSSQGLTGGEAEVVDGSIRARFTRPLGDAITKGPTDAIWAVGPKVQSLNELRTHTSRSSGNFDLSAVSSGGDSVGSSLEAVWKAHAWLMAIAWLIFAPTGILAMRRFKKFNPTTFQGHRALLILTTVSTFVGYAIALAKGRRGEKAHFAIGTIVMVLALFQVVLGALRPAKDAPNRKLFYLLHANTGRGAWILAVVNVFIGLRLSKTNAPTWLKIVAGVIVGIFVVASVLFETVLRGSFPSKEKSDAAGEAAGSDDPGGSASSASP